MANGKKTGGRDFKPGKSGNPRGRPPIVSPQLQAVIDENRTTLKAAIIRALEKEVEPWLKRIIEQGKDEGDVLRLKTLLEIALGKLIYEPLEFDLDYEEKELVAEWRRRKAAKAAAAEASGQANPASKMRVW